MWTKCGGRVEGGGGMMLQAEWQDMQKQGGKWYCPFGKHRRANVSGMEWASERDVRIEKEMVCGQTMKTLWALWRV